MQKVTIYNFGNATTFRIYLAKLPKAAERRVFQEKPLESNEKLMQKKFLLTKVLSHGD